ncbi:hypothetical protein CEUSTIGMA_g6812.t1 [Chlamydomonas eustigma]|uniref:Uncharacterized protein n=1 Tax=Chlamydomonas eustigma TaxID=1157962 RepID=A0A250X9C5_9CHLO|nr:hypothetical protein CEUSTIGMA_g6812.t1 [Chlamydomonas eustigma]|eukprot:GAX79370.1 hypothetical protein CEUSTIGMA_g6812.t1 [Chlamydomonas eustigma]
MRTINATWPHKDHVLINAGMPGQSFHGYSQGICLDPILPSKPDLIILEHIPYLEAGAWGSIAREPCGKFLEVLLHRIRISTQSAMLPPAIILNMHQIVDFRSQDFKDALDCVQQREQCITKCSTLFMNLPGEKSDQSPQEMSTNEAAAHYGMISLSYSRLLQSIINKLPKQGNNITQCQVLPAVYEDTLNPSRGGELLLADLLVSQIVEAQLYLKLHQEEEDSTSPVDSTAVMPAPLRGARNKVPLIRCYGVELIVEATSATTDSSHEIGVEAGAGGMLMKVLRSDGWALEQEEGGKYRPGWVSTLPGSALWLSVDLQDMCPPGMQRSAQNTIRESMFLELTYLSSFEHMGMANVTCMSGCSCIPAVLDGHAPDHRIPVPRLIATRITSSVADDHCVVQVLVLGSSSSGEHKVKVTQLSVKTWVDMESLIPKASPEP